VIRSQPHLTRKRGEPVNLGAILLTGLFAGGVSCAAVQGGLLAGLVARQRGAAVAGDKRTQAAGNKRTHVAGDKRTLAARVGDDLAPVGGFLAGKLVSHTVLGALLGAVGTAVELSVGVRAAAQLGAGVLIVVFGLAQLGVRGFRRFTVEPPASWTRFVRGRARSRAALAPALLGTATVLIPCGVTLSVEALALTSGSVWAGAATMAVFVLGTGPLFALLGYAARQAATAWRGRLAAATGLLVLGLGVYTFNGGLTLIDSPVAAANLPRTLGLAPEPASAETVTTDGERQTAVLTVRPTTYQPANIQLRAGIPTTLLLRTDGNTGCTRALVIRNKQYLLPETGDTPVDLGVLQPGMVRYRCSMGMYSGLLTVVE
jgi:sulfite exporter TauE/SafE